MTIYILTILEKFASQFSRPTYKNIQILILGAILCQGKRCVSSILRIMGLAGVRNYSKYHKALSKAKWSGINLSKILLGLLIESIPHSWPIIIAIDETLERRKGKKIKAKGVYRDAVRSSQSNIVMSYGLKWQCMTLIVPLPWCVRPWALPFLTILVPSKQCNEKACKRHKTAIDWAMQMVKLVSRWLNKPWILIGDGAYACLELASTCLESKATLISRLRLDAQLFEFPEIIQHKKGRKPVKGKRIKLKEIMDNPDQVWCTQTVNWYGGRMIEMQYISLECLWYHAGVSPIKMRIVLVKTPNGKNAAETFFSTDVSLSPEQIINYFVLRWNIEVTFQEARAHLGVETQRQWSDKAIERATPVLFGLFSLVTLVALKMNQVSKLISMEISSWYNKKGGLTFGDILSIVRCDIWTTRYFSKSEKNIEFDNWQNQSIESLIYQLSVSP